MRALFLTNRAVTMTTDKVSVHGGWVMGREAVRDERALPSLWLMRYGAPFGILVVFAAQLWK